MERAVTELEEGAAMVAAKLAGSVRLDVIEDFDLADDPVYQKLRKQLHF